MAVETCLRKVFCRVEYVGMGYSGWQTQRGSPYPTINGALEQSLGEILPKEKCEKFTVVGSGRTDAGVNALNSAFHLKLYYWQGVRPLPDRFFEVAWNSRLRKGGHMIRILEARTVPLGFHAQRCVRKVYRYRLTTDPSIFTEDRACPIPASFDLPLVRLCLPLLTGPIHIQSFCKRYLSTSHSIRLIEHISLHTQANDVVIDFTAQGFAWHQVRYMVGCIIQCGTHKITLEDVENMVKGRTADRAMLAPAAGLSLYRVEYDPAWGLER